MSSLTQSAIALACVFSGALLGMFCREWVPDRHRGPDSKDVVRLAMGQVVTTAAMALGLLVGSAKSFFDTQNAAMAQIAANYVLLDQVLAHYGPDASDARAALRAGLAHQLEETGPPQRRNRAYIKIKSGILLGDTILETIKALSPKDDNQRIPEAGEPEPAFPVRPNSLAAVFTEHGSLSPIFTDYSDRLADPALREFRNICPSQPVGSGWPVRVRRGSLWGYSPDSWDVPPSGWTDSNF